MNANSVKIDGLKWPIDFKSIMDLSKEEGGF